MNESERLVIMRLVEAMTLMLGENPKFYGMRMALFTAAEAADLLTDDE
jgi:hypothetical protein